MKAVADTSVLIALGAAGHLDLLHKMWEVIFIPRAVLEEVSQKWPVMPPCRRPWNRVGLRL